MKERVEFFKAEDFRPYLISEDAAAVANRILQERGVRVTGDNNGGTGWAMFERTVNDPFTSYRSGHTHTAFLIDIQPIVQDTPESLLRDLIGEWEAGKIYAPTDRHDLLARARRLLDAK